MIHVHDLAPASHDPTGTTTLRRRFVADSQRRWRVLDALCREAILKHALLGAPTVQNIGFASHAMSGDVFGHWFGLALRQVIMGGEGGWTAPYIRQSVGMAQHRARGLVVGDSQPSTLYVMRPVLNAADIVAWAKAAGFETTLPAEDMHVTICFSRAPVDWSKVEPLTDTLSIESGELALHQFGDADARAATPSATVLVIASDALAARHKQFRDAGASFDFPSYRPHITISYAKPDAIDLAAIEPYTGPIILGPEKFAPLDEDWKSTVTEDASPVFTEPGANPSPSLATLQSVTVSELQGICDAVAQQVSRAIGHGTLSRHKAPQLAAAVSGVIKSVGMARSNAMINYMVVKAFAAATLDVFRERGVERVGTIAEKVPHMVISASDGGVEGHRVAPVQPYGRHRAPEREVGGGDVPRLVPIAHAAGECAQPRVAGVAHIPAASIKPGPSELFDAARKVAQPKHARSGKFVRFRPAPSPAERRRIERRERALAGLGEVAVETAEDSDVCLACIRISEAGPYNIDEALGLVPVHPSCRCTFVPTRDESGRFAPRFGS